MDLPNRHSIRLKNYDYSSNGAYFITICTKNREMLFGDIIDGKMVLNNMGKIVDQTIQLLSKRFPVDIAICQIMPNHIHIIIMIVGAIHESPYYERAHHDAPLQKRSLLSQIIGFLKMNATKTIHQSVRAVREPPYHDFPIWQRNYWEHVIRNEQDFDKISEYIMNNPLMWDRDRNNPDNF